MHEWGIEGGIGLCVCVGGGGTSVFSLKNISSLFICSFLSSPLAE